MSESKQAQWEWVEYDNGTRLEPDILEIYESHGGGSRPNEAHARLIAAAPDTARQRDALLEAAEALTKREDQRHTNGLPTSQYISEINALRTAIADARGEHPWQPATSPAGVKHYRREGP